MGKGVFDGRFPQRTPEDLFWRRAQARVAWTVYICPYIEQVALYDRYIMSLQQVLLPPQWDYGVPMAFERDTPLAVTVVKGKNTFNFDLRSDGTFEITK